MVPMTFVSIVPRAKNSNNFDQCFSLQEVYIYLKVYNTTPQKKKVYNTNKICFTIKESIIMDFEAFIYFV